MIPKLFPTYAKIVYQNTQCSRNKFYKPKYMLIIVKALQEHYRDGHIWDHLTHFKYIFCTPETHCACQFDNKIFKSNIKS